MGKGWGRKAGRKDRGGNKERKAMKAEKEKRIGGKERRKGMDGRGITKKTVIKKFL